MTYEQLTKAKELETRVKALVEVANNPVFDKANSTGIQDDRKEFDITLHTYNRGYSGCKVQLAFDEKGFKSEQLSPEAKHTLKVLTELYLLGIHTCLRDDIAKAEKAFTEL